MAVRLKLLLVVLASVVLPFLGGYIHWQGLPPDFGLLAQHRVERPGTDWTVFAILTFVAIPIWSFVFKPSWFGFKGQSVKKAANNLPSVSFSSVSFSNVSLPWWFYVGGLSFVLSWIVMWGQFEFLGTIRYLMFVSLWWGFILFLDGIVYRRKGGYSFVSTRPWLLLTIGFLSMFGWYYFEYLNFFVLQNWFYPYLDLLSAPFTYLWSFVTFSTVWPSIFVWYQLLDTFPKLKARYANGPKTHVGVRGCWLWLVAGGVLTVITSVFPDKLFWLIWVGPLLITASALSLLNIWTPFTDMQRGDWTKVMTIALATVCNSLCWEMWNYWSTPNNPNFWQYNLPYVHEFLIFEMPLLGFSGYLFFGPVCWVCWILCAKVLGLESSLAIDDLAAKRAK